MAFEYSLHPPAFPGDILFRDFGTLRYGHALRNLRDAKPNIVRDLVEELGAVKSTEQLLVVLTNIMAECVVMEGKAPLVFIPNSNDLHYLLEDANRYSPQMIAKLLMVITYLYHPPKLKGQIDGEVMELPGE